MKSFLDRMNNSANALHDLKGVKSGLQRGLQGLYKILVNKDEGHLDNMINQREIHRQLAWLPS